MADLERTAYLRELVEAVPRSGFLAFWPGIWLHDGGFGWNGESEDGRVAFWFRDPVRRHDPHAYAWVDGEGLHRIHSGRKDDQGLGEWPWYGEGAGSETRAWADAFLALHRAGLLHKEGTDA